MKENNCHCVNISISLPRPLRDAARQAAFDDNRSLSSLIARLLSQHLQQEGYLEERPALFRLRGGHLLTHKRFAMTDYRSRAMPLAHLN